MPCMFPEILAILFDTHHALPKTLYDDLQSQISDEPFTSCHIRTYRRDIHLTFPGLDMVLFAGSPIPILW